MSQEDQAELGQGTLWLTIRRSWAGWAALSFSLVVASLGLRWSQVGFRLQAEVLGIVLVAACAGAFIASLSGVTFPDIMLFALASLMLGVALLSTSAFVLAHGFLFGNVPLGLQLGRLWWGFGAIILLGLAGLWQLRRRRRLAAGFDAKTVAILLCAATAVSVSSLIGFYDRPTITPGHLIDRVHHVIDYPNAILSSGLPEAIFRHRGVELLLIQFQSLLGEPGLWNRVSAYKVITLLFYFSVAYATYCIARFGFGATWRVSVLAGAASLVFGALYPTLWTFGDLSRSSYLGTYSASGAFYHNSTQLISHGMAALGVALIGIAWRQRVPLCGLGCALIAVSTFYKPSFIFYFDPAIFVLLPFLWLTGRITRDLVLGLATLILAPAAWIIYPLVMRVKRIPTQLTLGPLQVSAYWVPQSWNYPWLRSWLGLAAFVIGVAFAWPIVTLTLALADRQFRGHRRKSRLIPMLAQHPFQVLTAVFFGLSILAGLMIVETDKFRAGNLAWGTASAYLCAMPGLMQLSTRLSSRIARAAAWAIFAWQILSGARHLVRYVMLGKL